MSPCFLTKIQPSASAAEMIASALPLKRTERSTCRPIACDTNRDTSGSLGATCLVTREIARRRSPGQCNQHPPASATPSLQNPALSSGTPSSGLDPSSFFSSSRSAPRDSVQDTKSRHPEFLHDATMKPNLPPFSGKRTFRHQCCRLRLGTTCIRAPAECTRNRTLSETPLLQESCHPCLLFECSSHPAANRNQWRVNSRSVPLSQWARATRLNEFE